MENAKIRYYYDERNDDFCHTKTNKEVIKERYSKAIYQIDPKTGEIIQKFNSRIEATAALNMDGIYFHGQRLKLSKLFDF